MNDGRDRLTQIERAILEGGPPRLARLIEDASRFDQARRARYPRPQLARARVLARSLKELEDQLTSMHRYIRQLEHQVVLERRTRKYALQLLIGRRKED